MIRVSHYDQAAWLKWRRGGISASDAAVIAGAVTKPNRVELWLQKLGKAPEVEPNEAMVFGKNMEETLAKMYEWRTGYRVVQTQICCEADGTRFPMRATLDAIDDSDRIVEFKAVSAGGAHYWPEDGDSDNLPHRVFYQVQHQMRVADRDKCIVFAGIPLETRLYEVERRDDVILPLMELEHEFWRSIEEQHYPSEIDDADAEIMIRAFGVKDRRIGLSLEIQDTADAYEAVASQLREMETEKRRLKDRILSAMANNRYGCLPDGRMVDCNLIQVAARTQTVKAHTQLRLTIKRPETRE